MGHRYPGPDPVCPFPIPHRHGPGRAGEEAEEEGGDSVAARTSIARGSDVSDSSAYPRALGSRTFYDRKGSIFPCPIYDPTIILRHNRATSGRANERAGPGKQKGDAWCCLGACARDTGGHFGRPAAKEGKHFSEQRPPLNSLRRLVERRGWWSLVLCP